MVVETRKEMKGRRETRRTHTEEESGAEVQEDDLVAAPVCQRTLGATHPVPRGRSAVGCLSVRSLPERCDHRSATSAVGVAGTPRLALGEVHLS